jgi:hypothetical protein
MGWLPPLMLRFPPPVVNGCVALFFTFPRGDAGGLARRN